MTTRGTSTALLRLLTVSLVAAAALAGCKDRQAPAPAPSQPVVQQKAEPVVTREQAMATLMALPEVKTWSAEIEKRSKGRRTAPSSRTTSSRARSTGASTGK